MKRDQPRFPYASPELTKRELMAAMMLQGVLACPIEFGTVKEAPSNTSERARIAVRHADALLAELAK